MAVSAEPWGLIPDGYGNCCHTGNHRTHCWVPWMSGHEYDVLCSVCGHVAAWKPGSPAQTWNALCDCCAQDWSDWCDDRKPFQGKRALTVWGKEFAEFTKYAREEFAR